MIAVRLSKIIMTGGLALFAFLVTLGNITDYGSNWAFVQHVLSMDTIFPDSKLKWRAITDRGLQQAAYHAIIFTQCLTFFAFLSAAVQMARALTASKAAFQRAKSFTAVGVLLSFSLWSIGFMAIGGEWFAIWQSQTWNGQESAFRFYITALAVGIYVFLDTDSEPDLLARSKTRSQTQPSELYRQKGRFERRGRTWNAANVERSARSLGWIQGFCHSHITISSTDPC